MNLDYIKKLFCYDDKVAIITGGSQGIGKGIAISLAQCGCDVTILGRNERLLAESKEEIEELGVKCETAAFDIKDEAAMNEFFDEWEKTHNKLDFFINNAAYTIRKSVLDTSKEEMQGLFETNYIGSLLIIQRAAEIMKRQNYGNIVIVTSVNALWPLPSQGVYTTTKNALEGLKECLAADLCRYNIRVNTLAPGGINTAMNPPVTPEMEEMIKKVVPLGHFGEIDEMGDAVVCMVSDAMRYMTGATVLVDGGLKLRLQ
jgi:3-oxoacyl-[acyl-carrier protein] reductase